MHRFHSTIPKELSLYAEMLAIAIYIKLLDFASFIDYWIIINCCVLNYARKMFHWIIFLWFLLLSECLYTLSNSFHFVVVIATACVIFGINIDFHCYNYHLLLRLEKKKPKQFIAFFQAVFPYFSWQLLHLMTISIEYQLDMMIWWAPFQKLILVRNVVDSELNSTRGYPVEVEYIRVFISSHWKFSRVVELTEAIL